ncbi:hypothetical protein LQZ19_05230 [Treponema primitia]|uniref:hypothetical protein n=1 Tax=Treponema primitia TaxID=88058 RepID=UPI00397FBC59
MKQSEKIQKQIDEAKAIADEAAADAQKMSDVEDIEPAKAIAAIEKAQGKQNAAQLVISKLEPKLAAALKTEAREQYNAKKTEAEKAIKKAIAEVKPLYKKIQDAIAQYDGTFKKIEALRAEMFSSIGHMFEYKSPGSHARNLIMYPFIGNAFMGKIYHADTSAKGFIKLVDTELERLDADWLIPAILREMEPFEKSEPKQVYREPDPGPIVHKIEARDQGATQAEIRERLGLKPAAANNRSMGSVVAYQH